MQSITRVRATFIYSKSHDLGHHIMEPAAYYDAPCWSTRTQLVPRLPRSSHNESPGSKKGSTRIVKASSSLRSPHSMQRRRTTASQSARTSHVLPRDHAFPVQQPYLHEYGDAARSMQSMRPMSWHPGFGAARKQDLPDNSVNQFRSELFQQNRYLTTHGPAADLATGMQSSSNRGSAVSSRVDYQSPANVEGSNSDWTLGNTIADFETLAVSGSSRQSFESGVQNEIIQNQHLSSQPQTYYQQSGAAGTDWSYFEPDPAIPLMPFPYYQVADDYQTQNMQHYSAFNSDTLAQGSMFPLNDQISYATPTSSWFLPIQYPADTPHNPNITITPQVTVKNSKELIGMGLYDDKNGSMFASLDHVGNRVSGLGASLGRGLKLEETWKPLSSADAENHEADEGYSTDDAEEVLPTVPPRQEARAHILPMDDNLSNRTFFFDYDEQYNCSYTLDQGLSAYQSKHLDPATDNLLWF